MNTSRRAFITTLLSLLAWPAFADKGFHRHPHREKKFHLRRARLVDTKNTQQRIRREVQWGTIRGRRVLIVPKALLPEWELIIDNELFIVKYVHASRIIVEDPNGSSRSIDTLEKDTDKNTQELEGSMYETKARKSASD